MSPDELASKVARGMLAAEGTGPAWEIRIEEARAGFCRLSMQVRADMLNGHRIVHGGMVFALADTAFAMACNENDDVTVAAGADIAFLKATHAGQTLTAHARRRALTGRSGLYDVTVTDETGDVVAEFRGRSFTTRRTHPDDVV